jgi:hypothetical protein
MSFSRCVTGQRRRLPYSSSFIFVRFIHRRLWRHIRVTSLVLHKLTYCLLLCTARHVTECKTQCRVSDKAESVLILLRRLSVIPFSILWCFETCWFGRVRRSLYLSCTACVLSSSLSLRHVTTYTPIIITQGPRPTAAAQSTRRARVPAKLHRRLLSLIIIVELVWRQLASLSRWYTRNNWRAQHHTHTCVCVYVLLLLLLLLFGLETQQPPVGIKSLRDTTFRL